MLRSCSSEAVELFPVQRLLREIVSRLLKQFEEHGWVRLERGHVEVLEPVALLGIVDRPG